MNPIGTFSRGPAKASDVIGTDIINSQNDDLGDVKEVVIDPASGKVAYVVVSFGGFLGMGTKLFAIPFSAFKYDAIKEKYVLEIPKERLKDAPGFDEDNWPSMSDEKWNRDMYTFYDRPPYWE